MKSNKLNEPKDGMVKYCSICGGKDPDCRAYFKQPHYVTNATDPPHGLGVTSEQSTLSQASLNPPTNKAQEDLDTLDHLFLTILNEHRTAFVLGQVPHDVLSTPAYKNAKAGINKIIANQVEEKMIAYQKELLADYEEDVANQVAEALDKQAVKHAAELSVLDQEIMSLKAGKKQSND